MQYMLMIFGNEAGRQKYSKEENNQMSAAYGAYTEAMKKAGVLMAGERLQPSPRRPRCASQAARPRCSTAPMPTPRSSSAATT